MTKYKCVNTCLWLGKYWKKGEIYDGNKTPPYHFVSLEPPASPAKTSKAKSAKSEKENASPSSSTPLLMWGETRGEEIIAGTDKRLGE